MKRPIIWFSLSFMAGIYCCAYAAKQLLFCGILFFLICLSLAILKKGYSFFLLILFFCLGAWNFSFQQTSLQKEALGWDGQTVSFQGTVSNTPKINDAGKVFCQVSLSSVNQTSCRLKLWLSTEDSLQSGDVISGRGTLLASQTMKQEGNGFGDYLLGKEIALFCENASITLQSPSFWNKLMYAPLRVRSRMISLLDQTLSPPMKGILIAISTGDRSYLSSVQKELFQITGTSHVLSVSGLHVTILLFGMLALLKLMKVPYPLDRWLCLPLPIFLGLFMGGQASVLRACIMGFLFLLAECLRAESDSINSLFLAAFLILIVQPHQLFEGGFLLSFCSTFGILAFYPILQSIGEGFFGKNQWLDLVFVPVSSYLTSILILICFYHQLPSSALVANLIVVPLFPMVLGGVFLFALGALLYPPFIPFFSALLEGVSSLIFSPLKLLAKFPVLELATPNRFFIGAYCFLVVFCYLLSLRKKQFLLLVPLCFCFMMGSFQQYYFSRFDSLTMVQQGCIKGIILETENENVLVMAGVDKNNREYYYDYNKFLQYFQENNIKTIDVFCFMNYNKNTMALFRDLGKSRTIRHYLIPSDQKLWKEATRIGNRLGARQSEFSRPYTFIPGKTQCVMLYPEGKLLWQYFEQPIAEISKSFDKDAPLTIQPGSDSATLFGIPYSHQQYGTMRFLIKNGNICRLFPEYINEQEDLP